MTRTHFNERLERLREQLLVMGSEADRMLGLAIEALTEQNVQKAEEVISGDDAVDAMDLQIEAECIGLFALQAPVASDLRFIEASLKVIADVERIGDNAVDIAKIARKLARDTFYKPLVDIPHMANRVREMLRNALSALVSHDLDLVERVIASDDEVDDLYHKLREELHSAMARTPEVVVQASYLLFIAHYLERVADHIVNIAERVRFAETGRTARAART